jgi:hypothetical protein
MYIHKVCSAAAQFSASHLGRGIIDEMDPLQGASLVIQKLV